MGYRADLAGNGVNAMMAHAMQGDRKHCLAAGLHHYVTKPIRVNQLVDALMAVPDRGVL